MAVIYSKLGGCLGETAKLGPLARTDLWTGVKSLLDKLMTNLGLGSSLEDPWGSLLGMVGVGLPSQELALSAWEAVLFFWEAWGALCLVEHLKPCLPDLAWLLAWPAWELPFPSPSGWLGRTVASPGGRWAVAWEELPASPDRRWAVAWEELLPFPGRKVSSCWWRIASFPSRKVSSCWWRIASFPWRKVSNCLGRIASFPMGKESACLPACLR